jgi:preprotein translocase subunit YajC
MFDSSFEWMLAMAQVASATQPNPTGQMLQMLGTLAFFMVVMYLLMIRPQQKKAKQHTAMLKTLKAGDRVVTSGGVLGVVVSVKDRTVAIRSADTKMEIVKSAVTEILESTSAAS